MTGIGCRLFSMRLQIERDEEDVNAINEVVLLAVRNKSSKED